MGGKAASPLADLRLLALVAEQTRVEGELTVPLLSTNDFMALGDAMRKHREITLIRTMGSVHVEARTIPLHEAWEKDMGIQVRILEGGVLHLQTFDNVGEARQMVKEVTKNA